MKSVLIITIFTFWSFSDSRGHVGISYPAEYERFGAGSLVNIGWFIDIDHGDCDWDIYFSSNNGYSWSALAENLPKEQLEYGWTIPDLPTDFAVLRVVQDNFAGPDYDALTGPFSILPGTTGETEEGTLPGEFYLFPSYPNPFNSQTVISFRLPQQQNAEVSIYNIAGEKVETLVKEVLPGGLNRLTWNAAEVSSGVYFVSVETGNIRRTGKLILIK